MNYGPYEICHMSVGHLLHQLYPSYFLLDVLDALVLKCYKLLFSAKLSYPLKKTT